VNDPVTDAFTQANGVLDDTDWYPCLITYPNANLSATYPHIQTNAVTLNNADTPGSIWACAFHKSAQISGETFELKADVTLVAGAGGTLYAGFIARSKVPEFPFNVINYQVLTLKMTFIGGVYTFELEYAGIGNGAVDATPGSDDWLDPAYWAAPKELKIRVTGGTFKVYVAGVLVETFVRDDPASPAYPGLYVGFHAYKNNIVGNTIIMDNWSFTHIPSVSSRDYQIVAVSGGDVYSGRPLEEFLRPAIGGTNALVTTGRVGAQEAFGLVYFCAGKPANYRKWTPLTNTVAAWTPTSGALPVSGTKIARYITLYRGRVVLSGLVEDPHNWFMSAVGDPLNWDYGAAVSATMAVAGNTTDAGKCPDIVTCLAPYSDDLMYIGGDHTLWIMRGDPADRGRIDNISYQTGISGPDAFAFDPNGVLYFFGSGAIWRMVAGGAPEPLSRNRMDRTFGSIDLTTNAVHLTWDSVRHGLFIFIVPRTEGATIHYYWDERTDGFWKLAIPNAQGPTTVFTFDGDRPNDNAIILGGFDGWLRRFDSAAKSDDGVAINSYVLYPPIAVGGPLRNTRTNSVTAILDSESGDVVLTMYAEETAQKAIEATTIRSARILSAGRTTIANRVTGNAIMLKLSNAVLDETWAVENLVANVDVTGRTRKH